MTQRKTSYSLGEIVSRLLLPLHRHWSQPNFENNRTATFSLLPCGKEGRIQITQAVKLRRLFEDDKVGICLSRHL